MSFSLLPVNSASANSQSGSASQSCSGNVSLCPDCSSEYFYIYAYQYAYVNNSKVRNQNHNFNMNGFLRNSNDYIIQERASARHVFYSNGKNTLAIPYIDSKDGIWFTGEGPYESGEAPNTWVKLCPN